MFNYACDNCKHSAVADDAQPCVSCVPHSEGWSGFEARGTPQRTTNDIMNDLVRAVNAVHMLTVELNRHIK